MPAEIERLIFPPPAIAALASGHFPSRLFYLLTGDASARHTFHGNEPLLFCSLSKRGRRLSFFSLSGADTDVQRPRLSVAEPKPLTASLSPRRVSESVPGDSPSDSARSERCFRQSCSHTS